MSIVVSGFPGIGKTYLHNFQEKFKLDVLDLDSSSYSWRVPGSIRNEEFPKNYIDDISLYMGTADIICVSSHKIVREELVKNNIDFVVVYPNRKLKESYIARYKKRGNEESFVNFMEENWDAFIDEMDNQKNCRHYVLEGEETLGDVIYKIKLGY